MIIFISAIRNYLRTHRNSLFPKRQRRFIHTLKGIYRDMLFPWNVTNHYKYLSNSFLKEKTICSKTIYSNGEAAIALFFSYIISITFIIKRYTDTRFHKIKHHKLPTTVRSGSKPLQNDILAETIQKYHTATKWFNTGYFWNSSLLHWLPLQLFKHEMFAFIFIQKLHGPFTVSYKTIWKVIEFTAEKNKTPPKQSRNIDFVSHR